MLEALIFAVSVLFYFALFFIAWYFSMDIQNASKALWNACGNLKGKVAQNKAFKRRASDSDFQLLHGAESASIPGTPDGRDDWNVLNNYRPDRGSADDLKDVLDCGHFTEDEFLARFGGMIKFYDLAGPFFKALIPPGYI